MRRILTIALIALGAGATNGLAATAPADSALDRGLEQLVAMRGGPPGAIAVVQRGDEIRVHAAGVARVGAPGPPRADLPMRIASAAKAYNGATALALVDRGVLSLGDTIGEWLPDLPAAWHDVTLRQMLNHTSGLPDYFGYPEGKAAAAASPRRAPPPDRLLDYVAGRPLVFPPGSRYAYSNSDNVAIGLMVAAATGRWYERELRRSVLEPLGVTRTAVARRTRMPRRFIHGYEIDPPSPPEDISRVFAGGWSWASGGIVTTPGELNRFIRGYVGGRLFGPRVRAQQLRVVAGGSEPPGPGLNAAGLGVFRYRTSCGTVYGHTGNIFGYTQFAAATLDGTRSATVSINAQRTPQTAPGVFPSVRRASLLAVCAALAR